ncbi:MAG: S8 family serine peptidase [Oligoflexia bacterium]|nr:S8 family serine peptidase [Oligoflexia bacterium]
MFGRVVTPCVACCVLFATALWAQTPEVVANHYIIQTLPVTDGAALSSSTYQTLRDFQNARLVVPNHAVASYVNEGQRRPYDPIMAALDCAQIQRDLTVQSCEPDLIRYFDAQPNDPYFAQQWSLTDTELGSNAAAGWEFNTGSPDTIVAVIDSGINFLHPDLTPSLYVNRNELPRNGKDDDGNGYVDDFIGANTFYHDNNPWDCDGHGSHVSGIIAAQGNNGLGIAGVNWNSRILMVSPSECGGFGFATSDSIAALDYLYDLKKNRGVNIRFVNASYGSSLYSAAEFAAIKRLASVDIGLIAAAGNGGFDQVGDNLDLKPHYPASYGLENIIAVANFGLDGELDDSSNFGPHSVDIAAPGNEILSTVAAVGTLYEQYDYKSGTSMAAPHVTGALALLVSQRPQLSVSQAAELLRQSARPRAALAGLVRSAGTLDLAALLSSPDPLDQCPADSGKMWPGSCGCGVIESYADSDLDNTPDCIDGCPNSRQKSAPGICGCGFSDYDSNRNGQPDCFELNLSSLTPPPPVVELRGRRILVTLAAHPGAKLILHLKPLSDSDARPRTVIVTGEQYLSPRLKKGSRWQISYIFKQSSPSRQQSLESKRLRIKIP